MTSWLSSLYGFVTYMDIEEFQIAFGCSSVAVVHQCAFRCSWAQNLLHMDEAHKVVEHAHMILESSQLSCDNSIRGSPSMQCRYGSSMEWFRYCS